jgi:hypothetical protein
MKKEIHRGSCLNCPQTEDLLPLNTELYQDFGGYSVKRDGEYYYSHINRKGRCPTLKHFEIIARANPEYKWEIILDLPLRGATWERKEKNKWVLTETNIGFA